MQAKIISLGLASLGLLGCATTPAVNVWKLERTESIAGVQPEVLGAPRAVKKDGHQALCFDGKADGVFLPVNPIAGLTNFTIEILLRPDGDGPPEQRFLHIQDPEEHRVLMETRVGEGTWSLDTFLRTSDADKLTLLDRAKSQRTDRWYWAALVYDGKTMSHYVDGVRQLEGLVAFAPMVPGRISLGVRQNRIHWFKGCIAEVRFAPEAIPATRLRRP
ncbi:MAG TPA: LamG-like jellyroll fold domain-containing protein [Steroidobacteraceae bacterium]|nr:LamG-like jellyroll fold domain-containing protein [Steroidobacteraceae bacterium]